MLKKIWTVLAFVAAGVLILHLAAALATPTTQSTNAVVGAMAWFAIVGLPRAALYVHKGV